MSTEQEWMPILKDVPPDGRVVNTHIDDERGVRNEQPLKRNGRVWFLPDGSMYVYYTPTHFQPLSPSGGEKQDK
jgi:hypothetical protein